MDALTWPHVLTPSLSPVGLLLTLVLLGGYAAIWGRARRNAPSATFGLAQPGLAVLYAAAGVLPWAVATCSGLGAVRAESMQAGAWQVGLILAVAPVGLALGRPVSLWHEGSGPDGDESLRRAMRSPLARVLAFPLVTPVLAAAMTMAFFLTGWYQATVDSTLARELTYVAFLVAGLLFAVPLVGEGDDLMPSWASPAVRAALAFADGLIDAVTGIVLLTGGVQLWRPTGDHPVPQIIADQQLAGGVLLCLSEVVAVPLIFAAVLAWMRADEREARLFDATQDEAARDSGRPAGESPIAVESAAPADPEGADQPWWLSDPRFADRYRRS